MKKHLLNNTQFSAKLSDNKIVVLDGGARGRLFKPFNEVDSEILTVLRFEPDPDADMGSFSNEIIVPKALYNRKGEVVLNVAIAPTTSSIMPFNRELQQYIDPYQDLRKTDKKVTVECISLDEYFLENNITTIDFIKLDIHGCEYEVLEGAKSVLKETLGLLVENWVIPIHLGQKTRASVELFLFDKKFYVFEEILRSAWGRLGNHFQKKQPVNIESLYFKDPLIDHQQLNEVEAIKLIGLTELFGHFGFSLQLSQYFYKRNIIDKPTNELINRHFNKYNKTSLFDKIRDRIHVIVNDKLTKSAFK